MSHSKVCQLYNPYFKAGCDGWCGNQHLVEPVFIKYCNKTNTEHPPTEEAKQAFNIALNQFKQRQYDSAIDILKNLLVDYPVNPTYHQNIARFYERINAPQANHHFRKAISIQPLNYIVHVNYANYSYMKVRDNKTAAHHFEKALNITSNDSKTHGMYAKFLRDCTNDYEKSEYHFKCSLSLNPDDERAMYQYAQLLHLMGKLKLSRYYFQECIAVETQKGHKPFIWHHHKYALVLKDLKDYKSACAELEFCLSLNSKICETNYHYGLLLCEMNNIEKGIPYLYYAYTQQPDDREYEGGFNKYKDMKYKDMKYNVCSDDIGSTPKSDSPKSITPTPNHLEVVNTKKRKRKQRPPPPPKPMQTVQIQTVFGIETKEKETETEKEGNIDSDSIRPSCEIEFGRWLRNKIAINQNKGDLYYAKFAERECNDIRLLEHFDEQTLKNIIDNRLHIKMFQKQIAKFKSDTVEFSKWFQNIGVYGEYYDYFECKGILTFESFYHYIHSSHDIEMIIGIENNSDAQYIWNSTPKYSRRNDQGEIYENEGD